MIRKKLYNLSLKKKFLSCMLFLLLLMAAGYGISLQVVERTNEKLLYSSTRGTIVYSSKLLSDRLLSLQNMTNMMISDSEIQSNLTIADDPTASNTEKSSAYSFLSSAVPDYYRNFKEGTGMRYISLYNDVYVSRSDYVQSTSLSDDVIAHLMEQSHNGDGAPIWVTDYCNEEGLFLCRDIRQSANLSLATLGTVLINVDLDKLIDDTAAEMNEKDTTQYILYQNGEEIFHTSSFPKEELAALGDTDFLFSGNYGILRLNHSYYFYIKDTMPQFDWEFLALIPYDSVAAAQQTAIVFCLVVMVIILIICLVLFGSLVNIITGHLTKLIDKMNAFGQDETTLPVSDIDYSQRKDEIGALHQRFDGMAIHVQELIQKNYVNELLAKDAQLKFLESQINPHFLYNTLESINWRAKALGDENISIMVEALGALLRVTLGHKEVVSTIGSELEIVKNYMTIIQVRYEDRIQYQNEVPKDLLSLSLPQLTLQPLVENAINYALEEITEGCIVRIQGRREDKEIILEVLNTGSQFPSNLLEKLNNKEITPQGFGIGLINVQKRLQLQYGEAYGLEFINKELEDTAIVRIHLPAMVE